jgi:hypothetical protein
VGHSAGFGYVLYENKYKFETEFKKILVYETEAQMGFIDDKSQGKKSQATVPLSSVGVFCYYT